MYPIAYSKGMTAKAVLLNRPTLSINLYNYQLHVRIIGVGEIAFEWFELFYPGNSGSVQLYFFLSTQNLRPSYRSSNSQSATDLESILQILGRTKVLTTLSPSIHNGLQLSHRTYERGVIGPNQTISKKWGPQIFLSSTLFDNAISPYYASRQQHKTREVHAS